ncbi:MAG: DUF3006 domain-containing protein [Pyrinomonadaceae bacterium]|nr:DUF3006 domain-containing protein [Pyrinomonadaceae bacterium]
MSDKEQKASARSTEFRAVIDRIEDNEMAVVLLGDDEKGRLDMPVSFLPKDASDGDHLRFTITLDEESRDSMQDKIRSLQEELLNRSKT